MGNNAKLYQSFEFNASNENNLKFYKNKIIFKLFEFRIKKRLKNIN